jgi:hypothetical protein
MRLRPIFTCLPLVVCVAYLLPSLTSAQAAALDAAEAATLLAKSQAIDVKCAVLAKDQSQTLRTFVAQAEISLAEKASVSVARKAITGGRAAGKSAVCDDAAKKLVTDILAAATAATTAQIEDTTTSNPPAPVAVIEKPAPVPAALAVAAPAPKKQVVVVKLQKPKPKPVAQVVAKAPKVTKPVKPVKGLATYAAVAEKYFVARRCSSMSPQRINSLYKTVLANHRQALGANRPRDVRSMLKAAEARADNKSCT